jgi:hypothetical protein
MTFFPGHGGCFIGHGDPLGHFLIWRTLQVEEDAVQDMEDAPWDMEDDL